LLQQAKENERLKVQVEGLLQRNREMERMIKEMSTVS